MRKARRKSPTDRWTRNPEKEKYWRRQVAQWQESGLSVRAFCKEHGVVETSFYAWRRELIIRAREDNEPEQLKHLEETPNKLRDGRGRNVSIRFRQTDHRALQSIVAENTAGNGPFVPLSVVPDPPQLARRGEANNADHPLIVLTTPLGYQISISQSIDFDLLTKVLNTLEKTQC